MYGGHIIFDTYDAFGEIRVLEQGEKRYLSFGPADEQSAGLKNNPASLVFAYTQAMLLSLLYVPDPKKVLFLGLGAGSLATCLHTHYPQCRMTAFELRQQVIDVAYRFFGLPRSKRLKVRCAEAFEGLEQVSTRQDIIFSDIYLQEGMHPTQTTADYIQHCAQRLKVGGMLVTNCWREHQNDDQVLHLIQAQFAHVATCSTADHNWLIFASQQPLTPTPEHREQAKVLSKTLGYSLNKHLKRLQQA